MTTSSPDERGAHAATDVSEREPETAAQVWLARLALLAALAAIAVLLVGGTKSLGVLISGIVGIALTLAGGWWFLSNRGLARWIGAAVAVAAPVFVIVLYISRHLLWAVLLAIVLIAISVAAGRAAIKRARTPAGMPEQSTPPPRHPFVIMNPRSGGGKVGKFALDTKAAALGAQVSLIEGPPAWTPVRSASPRSRSTTRSRPLRCCGAAGPAVFGTSSRTRSSSTPTPTRSRSVSTARRR